MSQPVVIAVQPNRGRVHPQSGIAFWAQPTAGKFQVVAKTHHHSILEHCFNYLWCWALNIRESVGARYFAMLHDDVCPEPFWLDKLVAELELHDADVMSAVIPIKNMKGLTTTAVGNPDDIWDAAARRLTMTEAMKLPTTFSRADIDWPDSPTALMVNTGCWVCRFDAPWVEQICFRNESRQVEIDGNWSPHCVSEDWAFSLDCHNLGLKVMATKAVKLFHDQDYFANTHAWGGWETDVECEQRIKQLGQLVAT